MIQAQSCCKSATTACPCRVTTEHRVVALTPEEQLAFWQALTEPPQLTDAQRALGALMRGE